MLVCCFGKAARGRRDTAVPATCTSRRHVDQHFLSEASNVAGSVEFSYWAPGAEVAHLPGKLPRIPLSIAEKQSCTRMASCLLICF